MIIDCGTCTGRGSACGDCVISTLLSSGGGTGEAVDLDEEERAAVLLLAAGGLVPPLRLVPVLRTA